MTFSVVCIPALAGALSNPSDAQGDAVTLINGDVLRGTIVQSDHRGAILKHRALGTISIAADRINTIKLDQLEEDQSESSRRPTHAEQENIAPPDSSSARRPSAISKEKAQAAAHEAATQRDRFAFQWILKDWNNQLTLGLNGASGSTDRQDYHIKFKTAFEAGADRVTFDSSWYYATSDDSQSQNQFQVNFTRDWLQKDKPWFFFLKGQYKFDNNRSWKNRTSAFGGGGYTLAKTDEVEVNTRLGFGGTYEYGSVNAFTPEALFGGSVIKWHLTERAAIAGETTYYPSLEDRTHFRIESSLEWIYQLDMAKGLALKLGVENEYDSSTTHGTGHDDIRYYGAAVFSF